MIIDIITNEIFLSGALALIICHIWKFLHKYAEIKKFDIKSLYATGGMPSSHSSVVTALCLSVGHVESFTSSIFMVTFFIAAIIIRDAMGVRRTVDDLIKYVNKIAQKKEFGLRQIMKIAGHTPIQVLVGFFLGIGIASLVHYTLPLLPL